MDENNVIPASFPGLWIKLILFLDENMLRKIHHPPTPGMVVFFLDNFLTKRPKNK
jgi:hypothetical protein